MLTLSQNRTVFETTRRLGFSLVAGCSAEGGDYGEENDDGIENRKGIPFVGSEDD